MCGGDDIGDEVEEEGDDDGDVVEFEEEDTLAIALGGLVGVVVEHLDAAAGWVGVFVPVYLLLLFHVGLAVGYGV